MYPIERNIKGSNLVTWEAMRQDPLSQSICLQIADGEKLSLGVHNVDGIRLAGRWAIMVPV
jgi:hypothetical protein